MILDDSAHANLVRRLRLLLLGVLLFGALGLLAELALVEHWEQGVQRIPVVLLGVMSVATLVVGFRPTPAVVGAFRVLMVAAIAVGCAGSLFHFRANAIAERDLDPTLAGPLLVESALAGAAPALAPAALIHLALLGLVAVYRHPGLRRPF